MKIDYEKNLTPHFTVGEMFRSGTAIRLGIDNEPAAHPSDGLTNEEVVENLRKLCEHVLEPLRKRVGRVVVTSGYRCGELNKAVGGARHSRHLTGRAADIYVSDTAMCRKYAAILRAHTPCTELLEEPLRSARKRWIHVGYDG